MTELIFGKAIYSNQLYIDTKKITSLMDVPRKGATNYIHNKPQSKENLYVLERDKFKFLKDILLEELQAYLYGVMKYTNKFQITTSWFTQLDSNETGHLHNHRNCFVSGILYLQTSPDCGSITFQDLTDRRLFLDVEEHNIFNSRSWSYEPNDGLLILFPSEVRHTVGKNKSKHTRHSLAFNVTPRGLIGREMSDSHIRI
jgi:hypothetical protein